MSPTPSQFGRPRGLLGHVAGWLMAGNAEMNERVVEALEIAPDDAVLEVGSGPGRALAMVAARATSGFVAGIDISAVMVAQARRRHAAMVRAGRVELRQAGVSRIPYPDGRFDKALAVNTYQFWPAPPDDLRELRRVLRPGGLLALGLRVRDPERPARYDRIAFSEEQLGEIAQTVAQAGFEQVGARRERVRHQTAVVLLVRKP